jgi:hypothetical protein
MIPRRAAAAMLLSWRIAVAIFFCVQSARMQANPYLRA